MFWRRRLCRRGAATPPLSLPRAYTLGVRLILKAGLQNTESHAPPPPAGYSRHDSRSQLYNRVVYLRSPSMTASPLPRGGPQPPPGRADRLVLVAPPTMRVRTQGAAGHASHLVFVRAIEPSQLSPRDLPMRHAAPCSMPPPDSASLQPRAPPRHSSLCFA